MSWRKHESHKEETKAVKKALEQAGINAKVGHGSGTAWGWLEINIGSRLGKHHVIGDNNCVIELTKEELTKEPVYRQHIQCPICQLQRELVSKVEKIAREVTGRNGEYGGNILVLTQDHWDKKQNRSVPILQPFEVEK